MNTPDIELPELLRQCYRHPSFAAAVEDALDWVPELKHEGLVCTHISSTLRKLGVKSLREVTVKPRRYDMQIQETFVEAKYHLEGDLHEVLATFHPDSSYVYRKKGWNSAPKAIHDELNRVGPSWFLWLVCVRDVTSEESYIFPSLIRKFYDAVGARDLTAATRCAESIMSNEVVSAFQSKLTARSHELPTICGKHSALVSRLYCLAPT